MRRYVYVLCLVLVFFLQINGFAEQITILDMVGRKITIPREVKKVVPISASLRYIVYLDALDLVAGVEGLEKREVMKDNPAVGKVYWLAMKDKIKGLPVVGEGGPGKLPDLEKLLEIKPDLVITFEKENAEIIQSKTGIPVAVIKYIGTKGVDVNNLINSLEFLGKILNREKRARELNQYILETIADLSNRTKGVKRASIYVGGISARGIHGLTSSEGYYPPLQWINAHNVVDETKIKGHVFLDKEKILLWNPEYLFLDAAGMPIIQKDYVKNRPFYQKLKAVQYKKVYSLFPYNFYRANFETLLANAYFIGKVIYPEIFLDVEPEQKAREIFCKFVGRDVFSDLKKTYRGFERVHFE